MYSGKRYPKEKRVPAVVYIVIGIAAGILLKLFICDVLVVSGVSMEPAVQDGSIVFVSKLAYGIPKPFGVDLLIQWALPRRGDVVVYIYNDRTVIKRCVGTEGDPLDFSAGSEYSLLVAGEKIPLTEAQYQRIKHSTRGPDGMILAVGDNYLESVDSRDYGFVAVQNILGKVIGK